MDLYGARKIFGRTEDELLTVNAPGEGDWKWRGEGDLSLFKAMKEGFIILFLKTTYQALLFQTKFYFSKFKSPNFTIFKHHFLNAIFNSLPRIFQNNKFVF